MRWIKLSENKDAGLSRGSLIKFSASYPFEDEVVMMVCDSPLRGFRRGLITLTGRQAGINCYTSFPADARDENGLIASGKIYDNWHDWVSPEWDRDSAWILPQGLSADDYK